MENLLQYDIILASQSPRRNELLAYLNIPFRVQTVDIKEDFPSSLKEGDIVKYLAKKKADAFPIADKQLVITADTIVWHNGKLYGKPKSEKEAHKMLRALSGCTHQVFTGVCLSTNRQQIVFSDCTEVTFRTLSDEEIDFYISNYHPLDKAGAYGIQEWIGYVGITSIKGSYWNVMGLPIQQLYTHLQKIK